MVDAVYSDSKATGGGPILQPSQKYAQAGMNYSRDLSQRISAGFGARYQGRNYQGVSKAHAITATLNLSARFGRQ
jgi:hypothetical protein